LPFVGRDLLVPQVMSPRSSLCHCCCRKPRSLLRPTAIHGLRRLSSPYLVPWLPIIPAQITHLCGPFRYSLIFYDRPLSVSIFVVLLSIPVRCPIFPPSGSPRPRRREGSSLCRVVLVLFPKFLRACPSDCPLRGISEGPFRLSSTYRDRRHGSFSFMGEP